MKCNCCETIFPSHYKKCPNCGSKDIKAKKFKEVDKEEVIKHEAIVVCADVDFDEFEQL